MQLFKAHLSPSLSQSLTPSLSLSLFLSLSLLSCKKWLPKKDAELRTQTDKVNIIHLS